MQNRQQALRAYSPNIYTVILKLCPRPIEFSKVTARAAYVQCFKPGLVAFTCKENTQWILIASIKLSTATKNELKTCIPLDGCVIFSSESQMLDTMVKYQKLFFICLFVYFLSKKDSRHIFFHKAGVNILRILFVVGVPPKYLKYLPYQFFRVSS